MTRRATELAASENPLRAPFVSATAVSGAGAPPPTIRKTCAEPVGVKFFSVTERPDCAAPLTFTSMTQTLVGAVGESDAAYTLTPALGLAAPIEYAPKRAPLPS